jgi:Cell morphogenesis C-terminal
VYNRSSPAFTYFENNVFFKYLFIDLRVRGSIEESSVGRSVIASAPCASKIFSSNLSRSRSAQSLKLLGDQSSQDDKLTILAQLFWLAVSLLESDFEHEFLLALRLLSRVLHRLPLDRPDCRDKVSLQLSDTNFSQQSFASRQQALYKFSM